jgi:hypothetical protein
MRRLLIHTLAGAGLLLTAVTASAQYPQEPPSRSRIPDEREDQDHNRLFDRVRTDLDHAHEGTLPVSADRSRVGIAQEQIDRCQRAINNGDYDKRMFDDTVASVQRVIDLNRLSDQNRGYLSDDIRELVRLQSRLDGY